MRLIISWATAEPDRLAARLAALGFSLIDHRIVAFPAGEMQLLPIDSGRRWEQLLDPAGNPHPNSPPLHPATPTR